jgi:hypothetical protein
VPIRFVTFCPSVCTYQRGPHWTDLRDFYVGTL